MPFSGGTQGEECRIPFFGPLKGACPSLCPQKGKTTFFFNQENVCGIPPLVIKRPRTYLRFSSEVAWAAVSWIVDTEPGFISSGWISKI